MLNRNIDIPTLLSCTGLERSTLANLLFPSVQNSSQELEKLENNEVSMTVEQVFIISDYLRISASDFFEVAWQGKFIDENDKDKGYGSFIAYRGDFYADLNLRTMCSRLFYKGVFLRDMLIHKRTISLQEFYEDLSKWVEKNEEKIKNILEL